MRILSWSLNAVRHDGQVIVLLPDAPIERSVAALEVLAQEGFEVSVPIDGPLRAPDIRRFFGSRLRIGVHDIYRQEQVPVALGMEPAFALAGFVDVAPLREAGVKTYLSALTPTEVKAAAERADGVLVEPAAHLGDGYPATLRKIVGQVPLLARGMTDSYGIKPWIKADADVALSAPVADAFDGGDLTSFRLRLRNHISAANEART